MSLLALALMLSSATTQTQARVDEFVPYTDGRTGGCYRTDRGELYNCTRPPAPASPTSQPLPLDPQAQAQALLDLSEQFAALRRELDELKQRQAVDDAERADRIAALAAAERDARDAERREHDAAMQVFNEIEVARDGVRRRELEQRTEACRATLQKRAYRVVGPGACQAPDGSYVNCPDC